MTAGIVAADNFDAYIFFCFLTPVVFYLVRLQENMFKFTIMADSTGGCTR